MEAQTTLLVRMAAFCAIARSVRNFGFHVLALAVGVGYVVLTSVDRDDMPEGGANHFAGARCHRLIAFSAWPGIVG
jgi:lipoate synthase